MRLEDIPEVMAIEQASFSMAWPAYSYRRELQENRLAHYLVVREVPAEAPAEPAGAALGAGSADGALQARQAPAQQPGRQDGSRPGLVAWLASVRQRLIGTEQPASAKPGRRGKIVGYLGLWLMLDEAHITTVAVDPAYRGTGLGELLMLESIELADRLGAQVVTLEVRASNAAAQALYEKLGFAKVGLRRRYYSDDGEDAIIMTTDAITTAAFHARVQESKRANREKLGPVEVRV